VANAQSSSGGSGARHALSVGGSRVLRRWRGIATAWAASIALALPLALVLRAALVDSLGHSEAGERMLQGWDGLWFRAFGAEASGIEGSFGPGIVGIGAVLRGLDATITGALHTLPGAVLAAGAAYVLLWVFLSGGLIANYSSGTHPPGVVRAGAQHFARLLPLASLAFAGYATVWLGLLPVLHRMTTSATLDIVDERVAFGYALAKYGCVWTTFWLLGVMHDYARVMRVPDPSLSVLGALKAALRFVRRHWVAVLSTALGLFLGFLVVVAVYWAVAPGVGQATAPAIMFAFAIGQASIVARIAVRCWGHAARAVLVSAAADPK